MADLDPIKQVVQIDIKEKGVTEATKDYDNLQTSITETTTANAKGNAEIKKTEEGFKTLKVQLREAITLQQQMSEKYGATSAEAIKATKAVAGIKDEIGFQKDLVASYNPDEKFRKLTQTAGVAALALGGVKDGFSALGIESKTLDKIIGSAQAILGVTSAVAGMSDAYAILTASKKAKSAADVVEAGTTEALVVVEGQATAATWSWNAALLANPIVLIAAGVLAAVAAIYAIVKIMSNASDEEEKLKVKTLQLTVAIENQEKAFKKNNDALKESNDYKIALLKASGASEAQIYKETKALKEQELQLARNNEAQALLNLKKAIAANKLDSTDETLENQKKAQEAFNQGKQNVIDSAKNIRQVKKEFLIAEEQLKTDARVKAAEKEKAEQDKQLQALKDAKTKKLEEIKKFNEDVLKGQQENNLRNVNQEIQDKLDKQDRKDASVQEAFDAGDKAQEELEKQKQADIDSDKKRVEAKKEVNTALLGLGESAIAGAKDLFGKNKKVQKAIVATEGAVAIGKLAVNTVEAVSKDNATSPTTLGMPWSAIHIGMGVLGAASIISNTNKQLQALGGGSVSGGGGSVTAPTRNVAQVGFQGSSENQISSAIANQQKNQPPIEAFVVSQSLTNQQELDRKKELQNSF